MQRNLLSANLGNSKFKIVDEPSKHGLKFAQIRQAERQDKDKAESLQQYITRFIRSTTIRSREQTFE